MTSLAVLIDIRDNMDATRERIRQPLEAVNMEVQAFSDGSRVITELTRSVETEAKPAMLLLGPGLGQRLGLARQLHRAAPRAHIVFLTDRPDAEFEQQLASPLALIGSHWSLTALSEENLAAELRDAALAARQRHRLRTTLNRLNDQISTHAPPDVSDLRRYAVSDHFLASVLEHAQDAIIGTNTEGMVIAWNQAAERLFGLTADDVVGRPLSDSVARSCSQLPHVVVELLDTGADSFRRDLTCQLATDGSTVDIELVASLVRDLSGEPLGVSVIARDIRERKRAEATLRASEARYRTVVETASDGIVTIDADSNILFLNSAAERMFGYTASEIVGGKLTALMPPAMRQHHLAGISKYAATRQRRIPWSQVELAGLHKDGHEIPLELSFGEFSGEGRHLFTGILRDITDRKRLEDALRDSNQQLEARVAERTGELSRANENLERSNIELRRFAYVASHDLQAPLRSISGFLQLLQQDYGERLDDQANHWIGRVIDNTNRMKALIQDLLAYSRLESRARPFEEVDLNAVINHALEALDRTIREAGAKIAADPLPRVTGDSSQLAQLLQNLLENGIKYNKDTTPEVHVSAREHDGEWQISVRDNGIGIDPNQHDQIFEIFHRLHSQQAYSGTGIGLAVCRRIVRRHGGRIWVESKADAGSEFLFTLPKRSPEA